MNAFPVPLSQLGVFSLQSADGDWTILSNRYRHITDKHWINVRNPAYDVVEQTLIQGGEYILQYTQEMRRISDGYSYALHDLELRAAPVLDPGPCNFETWTPVMGGPEEGIIMRVRKCGAHNPAIWPTFPDDHCP